jgi:hypothetical protein
MHVDIPSYYIDYVYSGVPSVCNPQENNLMAIAIAITEQSHKNCIY